MNTAIKVILFIQSWINNTVMYYCNYKVNQTSMYLDVLVVRQARRNAGQSVVVKVQLSQVGDISQCAIFHRADLIVAQTKSVEKRASKMRHVWKNKERKSTNLAV